MKRDNRHTTIPNDTKRNVYESYNNTKKLNKKTKPAKLKKLNKTKQNKEQF